MAEVIGPLGRVLTAEQLAGGEPATANALTVLHRCAIRNRGELDESPLLDWAVKTSLGYPPELAGAVARRRAFAARSLAGRRTPAGETVATSWVRLAPETALLAGTGEQGVRNVGLALHGTYGWPALRGSMLKGVTHAYARDVAKVPESERTAIFGTRPEAREPDPGSVAFLDAVWFGAPNPKRVARHVLTPHAGDYYADEKRQTPPAEYANPVPVEYLAVEGGVFAAVLVGPTSRLALAEELLVAAVADLGVGAKTAAGYGYLRRDEGRTR